MKTALQSFALLFAISSGSLVLAAPSDLPLLPALNDPPTDLHLPGKFIWADLFASDVEGARVFYSELFDWEWRWINTKRGHRYGMFYDHGIAIAGVAERPSSDPDRSYGRWIYYISVDDVERSVISVIAAGGRTLLAKRSYAERGEFAIVADAEGALFGVMASATGDPEDYQADPGEWIWINLYSRSATEAARFYASLFSYDTYAPEEASEVLDIVLASDDVARGGVGTLSDNAKSHPTWLGYIRVEDVDASAEKATALGAEVLYGPDESIVGGDLAIIADPFGALVGLLRWTFDDEAKEQE